MPAAELHTPYGMTEVLPVTDVSLAQIEAAGPGTGYASVGRCRACRSGSPRSTPPAGPTVRSRDVVAETGEICVAAAHVKDHYDRLWATERESSRDPGWHRTGDVGHLDPDGRLWVEGRLVHVITTAAGPLTPVGLEQRVEALPGVRAAAAVGVGPAGTQQLIMVVVPEQGAPRRVADRWPTRPWRRRSARP